MDRLDLYRAAYEFEINRRREAIDHANWSTPIIVAMASFAFYAATISPTISCDIRNWFYVSIALACLGIIGMLVTSLLAIFNYEWAFMNHPEDLENYWKSLEEYESENSVVVKNYKEKEFLNFLHNKYMFCATKNGRNNDRRSNFVHKSKYFLIASLFFCMVTGALMFVSKL